MEAESAVGQSNADYPGGLVSGSPGGSQVSGGNGGSQGGSLGQGGNAGFYGGGGTLLPYNLIQLSQ